MDINANSTPNVPVIGAPKRADVSLDDEKLDDNAAAVMPFQAMLENQQPIPKKTTSDSPSVVAKPVNNTAEPKDMTQTDLPEVAPEKPRNEHTLDQLNYSRHLRTDHKQPALQAQLLNQAEPTDKAWLEGLKQSVDQHALNSASFKFADGQQSALLPFAEKTVPLNNHLVTAPVFENPLTLDTQKHSAGEEQTPNLTAFIHNEKDEHTDKPLFALNEGQTAPTKSLPQDLIPLNKKITDKDVGTNLQILTSADHPVNVKSTFTPATDASAFQVTSPHAVTTQTISMMPTPTVTQAVIAPHVPVIPMQPGMPIGSEAWQQQMNQHMLFFARQGISQAQIRLHPEELGSLNVHLRIEDNQAVMHFVSPHSHVRAAMETMMPILRSALQESGIHLAQGSVGQDNAGSQSNAHSQSGTGSDNHSTANLSSGGSKAVNLENSPAVSVDLAVRARGGIDTFA